MEIERALDILGNVVLDDKLNPEYIKQVQEAYTVVKTAVETAKLKGEWKKVSDTVSYWHECTVCGSRPSRNYSGGEFLSDFCPNCGAKMDMGGDTE